MKWIPCNERLPKEDEYNLVQTEDGDMMIAKYTHSDYWEEMHQLKPVVDEIVAWMPLPKKYKEKADVKENEYPCEHCKFATRVTCYQTTPKYYGVIVEERYWCSLCRMYDCGVERNFGFPCELFQKVCNKGENYEE